MELPRISATRFSAKAGSDTNSAAASKTPQENNPRNLSNPDLIIAILRETSKGTSKKTCTRSVPKELPTGRPEQLRTFGTSIIWTCLAGFDTASREPDHSANARIARQHSPIVFGSAAALAVRPCQSQFSLQDLINLSSEDFSP